jgi:protein-tyrosine phosphatase
LQSKGARLLLAHPERHLELGANVLERMVERGVRLQLSIGSFAGVYGNATHLRALDLADRGLGHVLATDLHHAEDAAIWLSLGLRAVSDRYGKRAITRSTMQNPKAMIADAAPEEIMPFAEAR